MKNTVNIRADKTGINTQTRTPSTTFPEDITMEHNTAIQNNDAHTTRMTTALRDGLIALAGFGVAAGSLLNQEITMWWVGA